MVAIELALFLLLGVYNIAFLSPQNEITSVINAGLEVQGSFAQFSQGLLAFGGILFGFYSVILVSALPKATALLKKHITKSIREIPMRYIYGATLILVLFLPFGYLLFAISNGLISLSYYGVQTSVQLNTTITANANAALIESTVDSYKATWYVFIDMLIYGSIEMGIMEYAVKKVENTAHYFMET